MGSLRFIARDYHIQRDCLLSKKLRYKRHLEGLFVAWYNTCERYWGEQKQTKQDKIVWSNESHVK